MKAIILCAGYATRLYPLTKNVPKALLPIKDKPIINYIVDEINTIPAIDSIYVISNDIFYNQFVEWEKNTSSKIPISILNDFTVDNETRLGAIGDINLCINTYSIDDEALIIAGDTLFNFKLLDFFNSYLTHGKDCVCAKQFDDKSTLQNFAVATIDSNNIITDLVEKPIEPKSDIAVFASYIYTKNTMKLFKTYLDEGHNKDAPGYFLEYLYKKNDVYAFTFEGECIDIGTLESYNKVKNGV